MERDVQRSNAPSQLSDTLPFKREQRLGSIIFDDGHGFTRASKRGSNISDSGLVPKPPSSLSSTDHRRMQAPDPEEYRFSFFGVERKRHADQLRAHHDHEEELRKARRKQTLSTFAATGTITTDEEALVQARLEQKKKEERLNQVTTNHSAVISDLLKRNTHFAELQRLTLGSGTMQKRRKTSTFTTHTTDTFRKNVKPSPTELSSPEALRTLLETNVHLLDAVDNCATLCSSVLSRLLPSTVYFGSPEDRVGEEQKLLGAVAPLGVSDDGDPLEGTVGGADDLFSLTQTLGSSINESTMLKGEALLARKQLKHAIEQRRREASIPVNHPAQAAADVQGKWMGMSQRCMVKPPLHCGVEGRHNNSTVFDAPNTSMLLPFGTGTSTTEKETEAKQSLAQQYALFMLDIDEHPERDFLAHVGQRAIIDSTLRIIDSLKANPDGDKDKNKDIDDIDVTEFVVSNRDDAARVALQQEQRNQHKLHTIVCQMHAELSYFLTGMDHRPTKNLVELLEDGTSSSAKPPAKFKWQSSETSTKLRLPGGLQDAKPIDTRSDSIKAAAIKQPSSLKGLAILKLTNEKFRAAADLVAQQALRAKHLRMSTVSSRKKRQASPKRSPKQTKGPVVAQFGERRDSVGSSNDGKAQSVETKPHDDSKTEAEAEPQEDLSLIGLREGLAAIKKAKARQQKIDDSPNVFKKRVAQLRHSAPIAKKGPGEEEKKSSDTLSVTEKVVGKKQAAVVEKFRQVSANTMKAPTKPWHEEGSTRSARGTDSLQQGRFDLFQRSPAVEMLLGTSNPRVQSARSSKYSSWTF